MPIEGFGMIRGLIINLWIIFWFAKAFANAPNLCPTGLGNFFQAKILEESEGRIKKFGPRLNPVFLSGETGTGKTLAAERIHFFSPRRSGPFQALNIAATPTELVESELFGHVRGAFTGASKENLGFFRSASGGTLFLDEIGELSPSTQVKLLRVLDSGAMRVKPVGSYIEHEVDVRLITASHQNLREAVKKGLFRQDLFYRLMVLSVHLPPLRDWKEDKVLLARKLLAKHSEQEGRTFSFSPEAENKILSATWPGNIRQLNSCIMAAMILSDSTTIGPELLEIPPEEIPNLVELETR